MPRAPPRAHEWEMKRSRSGAAEEKRDPPPHTCKRLISLLHYQASAAGTGFNSSSIYHWATTMVNLDYLLYLLPNPSITSTRLVQQPGNLISPKSWPGGFTQNLLSWEETELLDNLCVSWGGGSLSGWETDEVACSPVGTLMEWKTTKDLCMGSDLWLLSFKMGCCKCFVLDVSAAPVND